MASRYRAQALQEVEAAAPHEARSVSSDAAMMEAVRDGDSASLGRLIERYWDPLVRYGDSLLRDRDEAEDVAQETFVRVWRSRATWVPSGSVAAYLYRITRNLAFNRQRDDRSRRERAVRGHKWHLARPRPATPEDDLKTSIVFAEVQEAIESLPVRRREVFILSRFHQLTHAEIAEALEISVQTVANQMTTALADLRSALSHRLRSD